MDLRNGFDIRRYIRTIPDYPKPGILFRDITTLLANLHGFRAAVDELAWPFLRGDLDFVAGIEARGFILGGAVAHQLGRGFVPLRKKGKLPARVIGQDYQLEYGVDTIEIHADAIGTGDRVLLIDDLIATGGTANAAIELIRKSGGDVVAAAFVIDLPDLGGSARLKNKGVKVHTLVEFEGDLMRVGDRHYRSIWLGDDGRSVDIIDQTKLPHVFEIATLTSLEDAARAIETMQVRGAPLIGATAAYGMCLALNQDASDEALEAAYERLRRTRPTAINLKWALDEMMAVVRNRPRSERVAAAYARAAEICEEDVETNRRIGEHGVNIIANLSASSRGRPVNVLTHCNAGWIATVDWGTALAPIYMAHDRGLDLHVWVDETRPRNQGAALTAWELGSHGVSHTIVADNAGGHLMQQGQVDMVIVGTDRTTRNGDVANKIGTYLKALAAHDNEVPFYVALPHSTIDWTVAQGSDIPIEERSGEEVTHVTGRAADGRIVTVQVSAPGSAAANPAFDVTPARLVTGLITERGVTQASREGLLELYPEREK